MKKNKKSEKKAQINNLTKALLHTEAAMERIKEMVSESCCDDSSEYLSNAEIVAISRLYSDPSLQRDFMSNDLNYLSDND